MKNYTMARKCVINGINDQYVEVYYANAEYIVIFTFSSKAIVLKSAQYPSFSILENFFETLRGIEESELHKCVLKRVVASEHNEYYVYQNNKLLVIKRDGRHAIKVTEYTVEDFEDIVHDVTKELCEN